MSEIRIYVACLASYNAGRLHGRWIDLPQDADCVWGEIHRMLRDSPCPNVAVDCPTCEGDGALRTQAMADASTPGVVACDACKGVGKVPSAEEWAIHDHEGFGEIQIGEYPSIATVCAIASALDEHGDAFAAWYANGTAGEDPGEWAEKFADEYAGTYRSIEDYAEEIVTECHDLKDVPDIIRNHIDWEGVARDLELGGDIWSAAGGDGVLIFRNA